MFSMRIVFGVLIAVFAGVKLFSQDASAATMQILFDQTSPGLVQSTAPCGADWCGTFTYDEAADLGGGSFAVTAFEFDIEGITLSDTNAIGFGFVYSTALDWLIGTANFASGIYFNGNSQWALLTTTGDIYSGTYSIAPVLATPIPAALPLFATALLGIGLIGWRRRRDTAPVLLAFFRIPDGRY